MARTTGATSVAERPTDALWLAALPTAVDRLPATTRPRVPVAEGAVHGLPGAVTDMCVDGRTLIAACYGEDTVCSVDTATLDVTAVVTEVPEPYAVAVADRADGRAYVTSGAIGADSLMAVDLDFGVALADRSVSTAARGLAAAPAGDLVYVARCGDEVADVVAIEVDSGRMTVIPVAHGAGVTVDTLRISADGARLFASLQTATGSALAIVDTRTRRVAQTIAVSGTLGDLAVHPDGRRVLATGVDVDLGGVLTVVDAVAGRVVGTVALRGLPTQVVLAGPRAYVLHDNGIALVDIAACRVVDTIDIGRPVSCLAVHPDGSRLYIADYDGALIARPIDAADPRLRAAS